MKVVGAIVILLAVLVGGLWLLQGLGSVQLEPILCFGDCEPVRGPSATWVIVGFLVATAGALGIYYSLKRRR